MNDLRKAAQQALEALKIAEAGLADIGDAAVPSSEHMG